MTQMGFHASLFVSAALPRVFSPQGIALIADLAIESEFPSS